MILALGHPMNGPLALRNLVLALVATLIGTLACRPEPATPPDGPPLVRLEPVTGKAQMLGDGAFTKRRAIPGHVPSSLSWTLQVPRGGRFETHLSFARGVIDEMAGIACQVQVSLRGQDAKDTTVLIDRRVEPHGPWDLYAAELDAWGGQEVQLSLSVRCPSALGKRTWSEAIRWSVPLVSRPRPPGVVNVLLLTVDTLRSDHLGVYGYTRDTSANIDGLAQRGVVFQRAETPQSATWPALASLHTSLFPSAHGVVWNGHDLPDGAVTLAGLLHSRHYSTSAFLTNMKQARHPGFARISGARSGDQALADDEATQAAILQLQLEKERPFFLWLHLTSPHASYAPPSPWDITFTSSDASVLSGDLQELVQIRGEGRPLGPADVAHVIGLYDGEIGWVDTLVGRVLDELRSLSLEDTTLVVLASDHGEDLYEHNRYFFHSPSMYGTSLRVPLIFALPGVLPEGEVTDAPASLVDLAPTILRLLDLPSPRGFQGLNLLPGRALPVSPGGRPLFSETNGRIYGVSSGGWRLILNPEGRPPGAPGGAYPIQAIELYDLGEDPGEQKNVAKDHPEVVKKLTAEIDAWRERELRQHVPEQEIDPATLEELRALGYVFE